MADGDGAQAIATTGDEPKAAQDAESGAVTTTDATERSGDVDGDVEKPANPSHESDASAAKALDADASSRPTLLKSVADPETEVSALSILESIQAKLHCRSQFRHARKATHFREMETRKAVAAAVPSRSRRTRTNSMYSWTARTTARSFSYTPS